MARLLVTGSRGLLGAAVVDRARTQGWDVVAATRRDADVRDEAAVRALIVRARPHAVVHCAYVRDGPLAEDTIVRGSRHVAHAATETGARMVHLSSERVFGGRPVPYSEEDLPDPIDPYGSAKAAAEAAVADECPTAVLIRTSLLWRLHPPTAPIRAVLDALEDRADTAFFVDEVRCPTHVADLASACVVLAARADLTGPLHVAGDVALSRFDFARRVATALGHDPDRIRGGHLADHSSPRPAVVILDSSLARLRLDWSPRPPP
jgi:dTDP-4-dehydrorhamnose reductase